MARQVSGRAYAGPALMFPMQTILPSGIFWTQAPPGYLLAYPGTWNWDVSPSIWSPGNVLPAGWTFAQPSDTQLQARLDADRAARDATRKEAATPEAKADQASAPPTSDGSRSRIDTSREGQYAADEAGATKSMDDLAGLIGPAIVLELMKAPPTLENEKRTAFKPSVVVKALLASVAPELESFPDGAGVPASIQNMVSFAKNFPGVDYSHAASLYWDAKHKLGAQELEAKLPKALASRAGIPTDDKQAVVWLCRQHKLTGSKPAYEDGRSLSSSSPEVQAYLNASWGWQDYQGKAVLSFGGFPERVPLAEQGIDTENMVGSIMDKVGGVLGSKEGEAHTATVNAATKRVKSDMIKSRNEWCAASGIPVPVSLTSAAGLWATIKKFAVPLALAAGAGLLVWVAVKRKAG